MAKLSHIIEYGPTGWECTVEVDDSPETLKAMEEMILFWSRGKERIFNNNGDVKTTFLQQLAGDIWFIQAEHEYNLNGVVEEFENREGYYKMDGSHGIKIVAVDDFDVEYDHFVVLPGTEVSESEVTNG